MSELSYFIRNEKINKVLNSDNLKIGKTNFELNILLLLCDFYYNNKTIFVILPTLAEAQRYYDILIEYLEDNEVLFYPADELITAEMLASSGDFMYERINTLLALLDNEKHIVVTNTNGIIRRVFPKENIRDNLLFLEKGKAISREDLCKQLTILGYKKTYTTTKTGDYSRRGEIIDIYPFGEENPIRLDFFDDEIETIKYFDSESQRSISNLDEIMILPVSEMIYDDEELKRALSEMNLFMENNNLSSIESEQFQKDINSLNLRDGTERLLRYAYFFFDNKYSLLDYKEDKKIYFIDAGKIEDVAKNVILDLNEYAMRLGGASILKIEPFNDLKLVTDKIMIEGLRSIGYLDLEFNLKEVTKYKGNEKGIVNDLKLYQKTRNVILSISKDNIINKIKTSLFENDIFYNEGTILNPKDDSKIFFTKKKLPSVMFKDDDIFIINEHNLMDLDEKKKMPRYKSIYKNTIKISRYDELNVGDYVVHYDYGIGQYLGLKTLINQGIKRDYVYVMYANTSSLYIPVENISSLSKYADKEVPGIILHEIGGTAWTRTKERVRKKIRDISDRLIQLYASRKKSQGYAYPKDSVEQLNFEQDFEYELTKDQMSAVQAIKYDMEQPYPMDRLICGDVGYGKTEVALRAAFKAVYAGKQVALLAPTTILTQQHFQLFKSRMKKYAIRVELVNRFVSKKKQNEIIDDLLEGKVDVLIGTHRLLSGDFKYKDLGLLIVDEEQRFGVVHKEKIKELKVNVDCITLSATPIPRTLQMSILGIKDLSMIETPPKNRYPIQTYVIERSDNIIHDAIQREIARNGQVFYLYNHIDDIEEVASKIQSLVPEAKVIFGHGRMKSDELEKRIMKFIAGEYNVLVCTTIIETGIDIPSTNTLIIHDSDRLGLSQLYQIRGRVGRSSKIAYAYLMYEPNKILTPEAEKRLEVIKEFNELGSGFKIAMRDLAIRGSGDLLGAEQSGFVESVGLEMYMKILDEELHHKNDLDKPKTNPNLNKPLLSMSISENYVESEGVRIEIHKRIDKLRDLTDLKTLEVELIDRFGKVEEDTYHYMWEKLFKNIINEMGFTNVKEELDGFKIVLSPKASSEIDGKVWFQIIQKYPKLSLNYINPNLLLVIKNYKDKLEVFETVVRYLEEIKKTSK